MNEILLFIEIAVMFGLLLVSKRLFGKYGLFAWVGVATILAEIEVTKSVDLFGLKATLGNVMFASTFLATDVITEAYGAKEARKAVYIGGFSVLVYVIATKFMLIFTPNEIDTSNSAMFQIFTIAPRICASSILMYFIANIADVIIYEKIGEATKGRMIWLRNNVSTIICNCGENFAFAFLAFAGIYSGHDIIEMAISTSIIETIIALCDTPFLYVSRTFKAIGE